MNVVFDANTLQVRRTVARAPFSTQVGRYNTRRRRVFENKIAFVYKPRYQFIDKRVLLARPSYER